MFQLFTFNKSVFCQNTVISLAVIVEPPVFLVIFLIDGPPVTTTLFSHKSR